MNYKIILGIFATVIAVISYIPYFRDLISGQTKPHAFSWLIWAIMTGIAFAGQLSDNAGPGAWAIGFTALACAAIFILSLKYGKRNIVPIDWLLLSCGLVAILLWIITKGPLLSVILVVISDASGWVPTYRKSFSRPQEETLSLYLLTIIKHILTIFALTKVSLITALFPAYLFFANGAFAAMLLIRRKQLRV